MSMPNIPDITPEIDLSFEQATNLLLTSVAMEEISLSKLMDAETNKINYVLDEYKTCKSSVADVLAINASVNSTIINMIKLQMLLQFKLENIERLIQIEPSCKPCEPPKCGQPCEPPKCGQPCEPPKCGQPCEPPKCSKCYCTLTGCARGCIIHKCDKFCGGEVKLNISTQSCWDESGRIIEYFVEKDSAKLSMSVLPHDFVVECDDECVTGKVTLKGKSTCIICCKNGESTTENVEFVLTVWDRLLCKKGFHMLITPNCNKDFYHDSGFVQTKDCNSHLKICNK